MQNIFETTESPPSYASDKISDKLYPDAPKRCPHKDCKMPVQLKKHGFYKRNILLKVFIGVIRVRRYKCPVCGRTLSMLPAFCIPFFVYGTDVVVWAIVYTMSGSLRAAVKACSAMLSLVTRRHIAYWRSRFRRNGDLISYGLNQMSPAPATSNERAEDIKWTERFLREAGKDPEKFNADFHKTIGKSFMSLQTSVA